MELNALLTETQQQMQHAHTILLFPPLAGLPKLPASISRKPFQDNSAATHCDEFNGICIKVVIFCSLQ